MKKLILLLAICISVNTANAYIAVTEDLLKSATYLTQEQWTDKCANYRLKKYAGLYNCYNPNACPLIMYELKKHCWQQYYIVKQSAYMNKY